MKEKMRKINIGAGPNWYEDGWEVLDNAPGKYNEKWNNKFFTDIKMISKMKQF